MNEEQIRVIILGLIEKALLGKLPLDELYKEWPEEADESSPWEDIFVDVESAVEHIPIKYGGIDFDNFIDSQDYYYLKADDIMLRLGCDLSTIKKIMQKIRAERVDLLELRNKINKYLSE